MMRRRGRLLPLLAGISGKSIVYRGYDVLPAVRRVTDGELFGGTWVIHRCSLGRATADGYEVHCLLGDNDHFETRREALRAAYLRAMKTIELGEVQSIHLSSIPLPDLQLRKQ